MSTDTTGYTLTRVFDAPRELVWQCWTSPEHFAVWFGGHEGVMSEMVVEPRPGGRWSGTMTVPGGHTIPWNGKFLEIEEPHRLVLAFNDQAELGEEYDTFTVTLTEKDGGTELVLTQAGGHLTPEQYEQAKTGTASFLDVMAEHLAVLRG
ncbi:MAG TPA: SRPBCC domain-containing protein [Mycobacteriales bacterium]|nr:SRPBCC domain-containing protein [Mycobacteriales bacterium]